MSEAKKCQDCGKELPAARKKAKYCHPCRAKRTRYLTGYARPALCRLCRKPFIRKRPTIQYCCDECRAIAAEQARVASQKRRAERIAQMSRSLQAIGKKGTSLAPYCPTPEEIAAACAAIQAAWSPAERRRREVGCPDSVEVIAWSGASFHAGAIW